MCTAERSFYFNTPATLSHYACAMLNQELLCLKITLCSPSSGLHESLCSFKWYLPLVVNNEQALVPRLGERATRSSLSTFTLHLPISILNDGLFLNGPWLVMSNPKIPSNTVFLLSYSRATSFHSCLPCFTLTGTACLPPRHRRD